MVWSSQQSRQMMQIADCTLDGVREKERKEGMEGHTQNGIVFVYRKILSTFKYIYISYPDAMAS